MTDPTVAVHGKRTGTFLLQGLHAALPGITVVEAGTPAATSDADMLATLADDTASIADTLTPGSTGSMFSAPASTASRSGRGRPVSHLLRGAAAPAIAEFVLAAMLAFEKQLPSRGSPNPRTVGVGTLGGLEGDAGDLGLGSIGTEVARRALAFNMEVVACAGAHPRALVGNRLTGDL